MKTLKETNYRLQSYPEGNGNHYKLARTGTLCSPSYNVLRVSSVIVKLSLHASSLSQGISHEFIDRQRECVFMVHDFGIY
jgi:hypothetical protein